MKAPLATYRVQFNKNFNFASLKAIVPYLEKFGVSHIYASPIFKAKSGTMHGYDIVDSNKINDELGGLTEFEDLWKACPHQERGVLSLSNPSWGVSF